MRRANAIGTAVSLAFAAALVVPLAASAKDAEAILRLRAFAVNMNNSVRTASIDIVI